MLKDKKLENISLPYAPHEFPAVRIGAALANKTNQDLCFVVGGGIGDRVCAEPTLRFAMDYFEGVTFSMICETPELFGHLKFKEIFDLKTTYPVVGRHLYLNTYPKSPLFNQFINANMMNAVDFCSISALRGQLPVDYKAVKMEPPPPRLTRQDLVQAVGDRKILIHPGCDGWPSKTFPVEWWNAVIWAVNKAHKVPVLIGAKRMEKLDPFNVCEDLIGKTDIKELMWLCKNAHAIITNDSAPLHLAAPGQAAIAFVSTCLRGDLLMHHRGPANVKGWKMQDFAKAQCFPFYDLIPNHLTEGRVNELPSQLKFDDILPEPGVIMDWIATTNLQQGFFQ
jgi:Glycosyltransferase family 9 (heptosyltransferase)